MITRNDVNIGARRSRGFRRAVLLVPVVIRSYIHM